MCPADEAAKVLLYHIYQSRRVGKECGLAINSFSGSRSQINGRLEYANSCSSIANPLVLRYSFLAIRVGFVANVESMPNSS